MPLPIIIALVCAGIMGFAMTRGGTCMVAAVSEVMHEQRYGHLAALGEASFWVLGGIALAALFGLMPLAINAYSLSWAVIVGGILQGVGAALNRACVFGTVARLGGGEWHYLMTPIGFLFGCLVVPATIGATRAPIGQFAIAAVPWWVLAIIALLAIGRFAGFVAAARQGKITHHIWRPHQATLMIGLTFVVMMLAAGAWTYPEALMQIAKRMSGGSASLTSLVLLAALLGGAILGNARRPRTHAFSAVGAGRSLIGGTLMGAGALLTPGGNDHLALIGLPFLQTYAWCAMLAMIAAIVVSIAAEDAIRARLARKPV